MMLNEFDDEQTIEEEEELGQDDAQDEIRFEIWLILAHVTSKGVCGGGGLIAN